MVSSASSFARMAPMCRAPPPPSSRSTRRWIPEASFFFHPKAIHAAIIRADDDSPVRHRRRTADWLADFVRPKLFALVQRNQIHAPVVRTGDHFVAAHDGRTVHFAARGETPDFLAVAALHAMEQLVAPAKNDAVFRHRRRGKVRKLAVAKAPHLFAFLQIHAQELVLVIDRKSTRLNSSH